jgi:hypothetical protein
LGRIAIVLLRRQGHSLLRDLERRTLANRKRIKKERWEDTQGRFYAFQNWAVFSLLSCIGFFPRQVNNIRAIVHLSWKWKFLPEWTQAVSLTSLVLSFSFFSQIGIIATSFILQFWNIKWENSYQKFYKVLSIMWIFNCNIKRYI